MAIDPELNKQLQQYHAAIREEFALADKATPEDLDAIRLAVGTSFLKEVPKAVERIIYLMENAEKEATQMACAKYIIDKGLLDGIEGTNDPLVNLMKKLAGNDATSPEPSET